MFESGEVGSLPYIAVWRLFSHTFQCALVNVLQERFLLAQVQNQLARHTGDVVQLEGFLGQ